MILFYCFFVGLIIGSFINALVYRLKIKPASILSERSKCPHCQHQLNAWDLIPVLSFLLLRGHCRYCHRNISWQYPLVEILTGLCFVITANQFLPVNDGPQIAFLILNLFYIAVLITISVYDIKYLELPDLILLPTIAISLLALLLALTPTLPQALLGAAIPLLFFGLLIVLSRGKWLGGGDLRLGVLMGLILGFPLVLVGLYLACVLGTLIGVGLVFMKKKTLRSQIPFGPFLSLGTFIAILYGTEILHWYLNFLR